MSKTSHLATRILVVLSVSLFLRTLALGAPSVSSVSGSLTDGSTLTISGSNFGANGPNMVLYDDFEGGTKGTAVKTGEGGATIGKWDRVGGGDNSNPPTYDSAYSVSGQMSLKGDYTKKTSSGTDSSAAAYVDNIDTGDVFVSYWYFLPTTSKFPCYNGGTCNWKVSWVYGANSADDDQVLSVGLPSSTSEPFQQWAISCNDCYGPSASWYYFDMYKGNWYRVSAWVHATTDSTSRRKLWVVSPDGGIPITKEVDWTGRIFKDTGDIFETFAISPWARWCNDCTESAARYDDVYLATGPYALARVEIGNGSTYEGSTNLSLATVNSWSDGQIKVTLRQGSLSSLDGQYLYVFDANGTVNSNGYRLAADTVSPGPPVDVQVK